MSPEKIKALALQMQLAEVPPELRQAYMRLILDPVTIDHHDVRLEGPLVVLEKLSQTGASKSLPEVLSFAREWRAREDSNGRNRTRTCGPCGDVSLQGRADHDRADRNVCK